MSRGAYCTFVLIMDLKPAPRKPACIVNNILHMTMLTFRHSIDQSDLINRLWYQPIRFWSGDIAEALQEFKSCTPMYFIFLFHVANTFQTQIRCPIACAIKYFRVTKTIEAHSGIHGRWQTTDVAQLTARLLAVKVFGSRLSKSVGMYYANELTKHRHWCKVWHRPICLKQWLLDCRSRFWIAAQSFCNLHGKNVFPAYRLCGIYGGEIYSNSDNY